MSTTVNNNDASSSSTSASNNAESFDLRMKSMEDQINNLSLAFTRFMKEPMFSSNTKSRSQCTHDDSDTENEQRDDESSNNVDKDQISELNKVFNFPSNFQVNVAPFGTPEGITVSSHVKNNDTDLFIAEKRINDSLKPLLLMSSMLSSDSSNIDVHQASPKTRIFLHDLNTPLEFFRTHRVKLNDPIVLPLEDDSFKLSSPFDIEIKEVQYLNDDDLKPTFEADYQI
ncbi:hypothetical protein ACTFIW_010348 [Dictyostelium discoideum]